MGVKIKISAIIPAPCAGRGIVFGVLESECMLLWVGGHASFQLGQNIIGWVVKFLQCFRCVGAEGVYFLYFFYMSVVYVKGCVYHKVVPNNKSKKMVQTRHTTNYTVNPIFQILYPIIWSLLESLKKLFRNFDLHFDFNHTPLFNVNVRSAFKTQLGAQFMQQLDTTKYLEITPLRILDLNPKQFDIIDLTDSLSVLRITMIQNLVTLSESTLTVIDETKDLATKLELTKDVRRMYSEINKITSELESVYAVQGVPYANSTIITREEAPYLDFSKRKLRSKVWIDYCSWCDMTDTPQLNKGELFRLILKHKFRESKTQGAMTFVPPGVR